jgi:hypothetical protein
LLRRCPAADRVITPDRRRALVGAPGRRRERGRERLLAQGHGVAEFWIVASGPTARRRTTSRRRVIRAGEPIVLDIGGTVGGYASDICADGL